MKNKFYMNCIDNCYRTRMIRIDHVNENGWEYFLYKYPSCGHMSVFDFNKNLWNIYMPKKFEKYFTKIERIKGL